MAILDRQEREKAGIKQPCANLAQGIEVVHSKFDFKLTARDKDILRTLQTILIIEKRASFSADDLFLYGLDRFYADRVHGVGGFFARCQHAKLIAPVGMKRSTRASNHLRMVKMFEITLPR